MNCEKWKFVFCGMFGESLIKTSIWKFFSSCWKVDSKPNMHILYKKMYSNANPIFTIFTSPKLIGTICIPELNDFHHSIPYKTLILLSRKKASPLITFFAQTLKCNTKVTFEFLNPNIFTKLSIVTFASVNSLKKDSF